MKSVLDYVYEQELGAFFVLSPANLNASKEEFHDAVCPYVDARGGNGFAVTDAHAESQSGYRRRDGGLGRYDLVSCKRVATNPRGL
ncbi:MAG: hypothetical protein ABIN08_17100 [Caldimonas sp.]